MAKKNMTPEEKAHAYEQTKKWKEAHPNYMKEYMQKYNEEHKEEKKVVDREYHQAHKEERNAYRRQWTVDHPGHQLAHRRKKRLEDPLYDRRHMLKTKYGITAEEYDEMLESQGNGCAICSGRELQKGRYHMHVDHNHVTGQVRGILCHKCNSLLGMAKDSIEILNLAIAYLEAYATRKSTPEPPMVTVALSTYVASDPPVPAKDLACIEYTPKGRSTCKPRWSAS